MKKGPQPVQWLRATTHRKTPSERTHFSVSTSTLSAPTDTAGWLLEITGTGDKIQYKAVDNDGRGIAVVNRLSDGTWLLVALTFFCGEDALVPLTFEAEANAVSWLTYLANCYTRPAAGA